MKLITQEEGSVSFLLGNFSKERYLVVNFRLLNTHILHRNTATSLFKDFFNILDNSKYETLSCVDIKDTFHSIPLSPQSKVYCGILPYTRARIFRARLFQVFAYIGEIFYVQMSLIDSNVNLPLTTSFFILSLLPILSF